MDDIWESDLVNEKTKEELLLEENGFEIICESPFEIRYTETDDIATGYCADCIIEFLENN